MDKSSGLDIRDVVGGQPGVRDGDDLAGLAAASALLGVRVVAVEGVRLSDLDVTYVKPEVAEVVVHRRRHSANAGRPRGRNHDRDVSEVNSSK